VDKPTFSSILDRPSGEIKRPPPLPEGDYIWVIKGLPEHGKSPKKLTPFVKFVVVPVTPLDTVDPELLAEVGGYADKIGTLTFYDTENAGYRLTEFLVDDLQIDNEGGEKHARAMLDEVNGRQFIGHVKHTPTGDGKGIRWEISSTAPVNS
jgi:hypothetical protein